MEDFDKVKDNKDHQKKAGTLAGAALAGALAAASPAQAQDSGYQDFVGDSYSVEYGSTFSASEDALKAVDALSTKFKPGIGRWSDTDFLNQAMSAVDTFVSAHPFTEGKTITTNEGASSEPSYDPLFDLRMAVEAKALSMEPIVIGILFQAIRQGENSRLRKMENENK